MSLADTCAMAVMAKAPRPNHVKTRLVPPLTAAEAASLTASFLRDITENIREASRSALLHGYVAYAPAGCEALFDGMLAAGTRPGAGRRQHPDAAGRRRLRPVAVPCGGVAAGAGVWRGMSGQFRQSHPADGIFGACGRGAGTARRPHGAGSGRRWWLLPDRPQGPARAVLFRDIAWSTDEVSTQTLARAATAGLDVIALPLWFDVDDAASLARLMEDLGRPAGIDPTPYAAPATRWWAEELGYARIGRQAGRDAENPRPLVGLGREAHQG